MYQCDYKVRYVEGANQSLCERNGLIAENLFMLLINRAYQKLWLHSSLAEYYLKGLVNLIELCNLFAQIRVITTRKYKSIYMMQKIQVQLPESTRRVLQPAFCPNSISVSSLSPTIHILEQLKLNLLEITRYVLRREKYKVKQNEPGGKNLTSLRI